MLKLVGFLVVLCTWTLHWHRVCLNLVVYQKGAREPFTSCLLPKPKSYLTYTGRAVLQNRVKFAVKQNIQKFYTEDNRLCSMLNTFLKMK